MYNGQTRARPGPGCRTDSGCSGTLSSLCRCPGRWDTFCTSVSRGTSRHVTAHTCGPSPFVDDHFDQGCRPPPSHLAWYEARNLPDISGLQVHVDAPLAAFADDRVCSREASADIFVSVWECWGVTEEVFAGHVEEAAGRLLVIGAVSEETLGFDEFDGANLCWTFNCEGCELLRRYYIQSRVTLSHQELLKAPYCWHWTKSRSRQGGSTCQWSFSSKSPNTPPILSSLSHIFAPRDYTDTTENSGTASYIIQLEGLLIRLPRPSRLRLPPPQGIYDSDLGRKDRGAPSPGHGSSLTATNGSRERVRAARAGVTATCRRAIYLREGANAHGRASADQVVGQEGRERASPPVGTRSLTASLSPEVFRTPRPKERPSRSFCPLFVHAPSL